MQTLSTGEVPEQVVDVAAADDVAGATRGGVCFGFQCERGRGLKAAVGSKWDQVLKENFLCIISTLHMADGV